MGANRSQLDAAAHLKGLSKPFMFFQIDGQSGLDIHVSEVRQSICPEDCNRLQL